jgi:hypothetical protein
MRNFRHSDSVTLFSVEAVADFQLPRLFARYAGPPDARRETGCENFLLAIC